MANPYKKLEIKQFPKTHTGQLAEESYWKKFRFSILVQQSAAVTCVDFSPTSPHDFVVTSALQAQIFNISTSQVKKRLSRFKDVAYSARYRSDGQLLVAGGEECNIRIFDPNSSSVLRNIHNAHRKPIHVTSFSPNNKHILSASDDASFACWDIATQDKLVSINGHKDQIRCATISPVSENIWITGSMDHTVKIWDMRSKECITTLNHDNPIGDLLITSSGGILMSASALEINVWDVLGGFRCLKKITNHQKVVTGLVYDESRSRLLASSLECSIKIYDMDSYSLLNTIKYPAPILTLGISPNNSHLVAGMSDGMLSIRHQIIKMQDQFLDSSIDQERQTGQIGFHETINDSHMLRGTNLPSSSGNLTFRNSNKKTKLQLYDRFLRKFQYKKALDAALCESQPNVAVSLFEEFIRRQALSIPLSGRNEVMLKPILTFILKHIVDPKYMYILLHIANTLLVIYHSVIGQSIVISGLCLKIQARIREEINMQKQLFQLQGIFDSLFAAHSIAKAKRRSVNKNNPELLTIKPSHNLQVYELMGLDL